MLVVEEDTELSLVQALGGPSVVPDGVRMYDASHAVAYRNISELPLPVDELTFHRDVRVEQSSLENMYRMPYHNVTELTSHPEMSALNADALINICPMLVTELTSHPEMSALNAGAS